MMKNGHNAPWIGFTLAMSILGLCSSAQAAPGEDTIILSGKVSYATMPLPRPSASTQLDPATPIPAWMQARISRYTAKAYSASAEDGSIYTDSDVVTTVQSEGLRKTCVQEVGSNTTATGSTLGNRYGPKAQEQVVVLRGDLVNLCR